MTTVEALIKDTPPNTPPLIMDKSFGVPNVDFPIELVHFNLRKVDTDTMVPTHAIPIDIMTFSMCSCSIHTNY